MIKNAESHAAVYTQKSTFTNEKTLVAFLHPNLTIKTSKVTHS